MSDLSLFHRAKSLIHQDLPVRTSRTVRVRAALPGTPAKVELMAERAGNGQQAQQAHDITVEDCQHLGLVATETQANGAATRNDLEHQAAATTTRTLAAESDVSRTLTLRERLAARERADEVNWQRAAAELAEWDRKRLEQVQAILARRGEACS